MKEGAVSGFDEAGEATGMDKEILEVVLKRAMTDCSIVRILEATTESAIPKGENFVSSVLQLKIKVVLGNGRVANRSLIMKTSRPNETAEPLRKASNIFALEATVYCNFLNEMDYLLEEFEDHDGPLWCKMVYYDPKEPILLLEDLKVSGFSVVPRQVGIDLDHALLALSSLGRYHAMTKTLEERGMFSKDDYQRTGFSDGWLKTILYGGTMCTAEGIRRYGGPKWEHLAEKLTATPLEVYYEKAKKSTVNEDGIFTCLNHGDCWSNNMMFKYDWQNRPVSMKFVDYQFPKYTSACNDVSYFMYSSIQPKVRRENYKLLLECYHESLIRTLDKYGFTGQKPSLEDIEKVMERLKFFGLFYFTCFYGMLTCNSSESMDLPRVAKSGGKEGFNVEVYNEPGMIQKLEADLADFVEMLSAS